MFDLSELSKSVSQLEPHIEGFKEKADSVSEDIKTLEKYLSGKLLGLEIGINIGNHEVSEEHLKLFNLATFDDNLSFVLREFLCLHKDESNQKYRIMYLTHSLAGDGGKGFRVKVEKKPLIECSLFDRMRMHSKLPLLVDHIKVCLTGE